MPGDTKPRKKREKGEKGEKKQESSKHGEGSADKIPATERKPGLSLLADEKRIDPTLSSLFAAKVRMIISPGTCVARSLRSFSRLHQPKRPSQSVHSPSHRHQPKQMAKQQSQKLLRAQPMDPNSGAEMMRSNALLLMDCQPASNTKRSANAGEKTMARRSRMSICGVL